MSKKTKSPEIERFKSVLAELGETPGSIEEKTGVSARTINNYIWGDTALGGPLLRVLSEQFGVSVDWLLSGRGSMFMQADARQNPPRFLVRFQDDFQEDSFQDHLWLMARCIEESMYHGGGWPGEDYTLMDVYTLAMPYALEKLREGKVDLLANASAGK